MDSLRPERDELDRFNSRQAKKPKKKAASKVKEAPKSRSGLMAFVGFALLGLCGVLAWGYMNQQTQLEALQKDLHDASSFIGQSKLLMARFEGELNETGEEMMESGSAVDKKLAFLDSEMRKLWGVSNDRNKKSIKNNAQAVVDLEETIAGMRLAQENKLKAYDQKLAGFGKSLSQLESMATVAASEIAVTRESINDELSGVKQSIALLDKLDSQIRENTSAVESIDASRRQLNERIVKLEKRTEFLRLKLNNPASNTAPTTPNNAAVTVP